MVAQTIVKIATYIISKLHELIYISEVPYEE